eukprot:4813603-Pleurochrysis_carterae.AAC.1
MPPGYVKVPFCLRNADTDDPLSEPDSDFDLSQPPRGALAEQLRAMARNRNAQERNSQPSVHEDDEQSN